MNDRSKKLTKIQMQKACLKLWIINKVIIASSTPPPPPPEEPSELEKDLVTRFDFRYMDLRLIVGVMSITWYPFCAIGIFVIRKKKQKKNQDPLKQEMIQPFQPQ